MLNAMVMLQDTGLGIYRHIWGFISVFLKVSARPAARVSCKQVGLWLMCACSSRRSCAGAAERDPRTQLNARLQSGHVLCVCIVTSDLWGAATGALQLWWNRTGVVVF